MKKRIEKEITMPAIKCIDLSPKDFLYFKMEIAFLSITRLNSYKFIENQSFLLKLIGLNQNFHRNSLHHSYP